jgi:hypothetical protein
MTDQITDNWQVAKAALCARIRRRWTALVRLNPDLADSDSIEMHLQAAGDDAAALFRLADHVDRRLDLVFASRARRTDPPGNVVRGRPAHDEFKTS